MLRSPYGMSRPSVVCDVRAPLSEGSTFRQYFAPPNSSGTWAVSVKFLEQKFEGILGDRAS